MGRVIPIIYFIIVIPALLQLFFYLFRLMLNVYRETWDSMNLGKSDAILPSGGGSLGYWSGPRVMENIWGMAGLLLLFAINFALGNLTAKLTIDSKQIKYTEYTIPKGYSVQTIPINEVSSVCMSDNRSYLNGGHKYWDIGNNSDIEIDTARINQQDEMLSAILNQNDNLQLRKDVGIYGCYKSKDWK